ncbi:ORF6N domain-containing protein [Moellerella wisconsensis]|uniref:ORF6N domain-containing protein n=1 Tax=Moellerella wisconsensis TaxID=158849 RepID=UPI001F4DF4D0|nr:ORF6N domain-containing protein [Moellerella wisconsensis]UNH28464.1 ORF6N domain-containing protein [Moellerella wisconsensis]
MRQVTINATSLSPFMYQGKRVVTFAMIDEVHQRSKGSSRVSFNRHRQYFTEGKDFYRLTGQDLELFKLCAYQKGTHKKEPINNNVREITLITESGYLLTVKPFNDPLSWQVQNQLIDAYFRMSEFPELQHINIPTLAELEAMPIGEAQNLISSLEADSYQGHGRRGSYAMNLRRKEKKALKPMVIAIEQASQLHIQDMGGYRS